MTKILIAFQLNGSIVLGSLSPVGQIAENCDLYTFVAILRDFPSILVSCSVEITVFSLTHVVEHIDDMSSGDKN